ncbi:conjugal transfer protein TraD [Reyranella sp.]|uniref:conjugal transfer protein TraD n=1 Tax=Reyranella sp. TaxID=1929291 RepID=UPI003BACE34F
MQQLGELVIATGADALNANELAGALVVLAETTDAGKRDAWAKRGVAWFQSKSRRSARVEDRNNGSNPTQSGGAQPAIRQHGRGMICGRGRPNAGSARNI